MKSNTMWEAVLHEIASLKIPSPIEKNALNVRIVSYIILQYTSAYLWAIFVLFRATLWKSMERRVCCSVWGQFPDLVSRSRPEWSRGRDLSQGRTRNVGSWTGKRTPSPIPRDGSNTIWIFFFQTFQNNNSGAIITRQ